ncbi:ATP-binding protein [Candidatus Bipolaricaulota bacterium]|nr:ATP-binding protein [Candidatus Bipolaricaulota bacterium]
MGKSLHISKDLDINLEDLIGQCIAILGIRGSGKSNTAGVIFEELLENNYPLSIVDLEGEYFGLKEKYEVLVVGKGEGVEIEIDAHCAPEIAQVSMEQNVPVVLDLSGFLSEERTELLKAYLSALWNLAGTLRKPYMIGIEEAHEFIPQGVKNELKEMISRIALRGRKRGLGGIVVSQRSAKVDKDVLSQAGMLFLHRVVHEVDMRVYCELLPWRKSEVKEIIGSLDTGDCMYVNGDNILPIYVRERSTFHAGFTPSLETVKSPELRSVSASIIETIEKARVGKGPKSPTEQLEQRIEMMERMMGSKDQRIAELEDVARTLGYIKLEIPSFAKEVLAPGSLSEKEVRVSNSLPVVVADDSTVDITESVQVASLDEPELITALVQGVGNESDGTSCLLPPAVNQHIERLISRFSREEMLHRRVLAFLIEHSPGAYSAHQIAAWTSCPQELIDEDPPQGFLNSGLIQRERRTSGTLYRSALRTFVNREFRVFQPDIGDNGLHHVTRLLRDRLPMIA